MPNLPMVPLLLPTRLTFPASVSRARGGNLAQPARLQPAKAGPSQGPLTGSLTVEGFRLSGNGLSRPIQAPKLVLEPAAFAQGQAQTLAGTVAVPMGGTTPLTVNVRLELKGYQVAMRGQVSIARGRELAHAVGISQASALSNLAGDPLVVDLSAQGPWLPAPELPFGATAAGGPTPAVVTGAMNRAGKATAADAVAIPAADTLSGTVTLHNANWKADYLANHVVISNATLHVDLAEGLGDSIWDPVDFSYGPLKGTASFRVPGGCDMRGPCPTQFQVQFADLNAATVQTAILGARVKARCCLILLTGSVLHPRPFGRSLRAR